VFHLGIRVAVVLNAVVLHDSFASLARSQWCEAVCAARPERSTHGVASERTALKDPGLAGGGRCATGADPRSKPAGDKVVAEAHASRGTRGIRALASRACWRHLARTSRPLLQGRQRRFTRGARSGARDVPSDSRSRNRADSGNRPALPEVCSSCSGWRNAPTRTASGSGLKNSVVSVGSARVGWFRSALFGDPAPKGVGVDLS
jgi:hypothetical protein